jgi:hypothetical protein
MSEDLRESRAKTEPRGDHLGLPERQAAQSISSPCGGMLYSPVLSRRNRKQGAGGGPVGTQMYGAGPIDAAVRATSKCASASAMDLGRLKSTGTARASLDARFFAMIIHSLHVKVATRSSRRLLCQSLSTLKGAGRQLACPASVF